MHRIILFSGRGANPNLFVGTGDIKANFTEVNTNITNLGVAYAKIDEIATSSAHLISQAPEVIAGLNYTISFEALAGERTWCRATLRNTTIGVVYFDLTNGVVGTATGTSRVGQTMTAVGGGWYLCSVTYTALLTNDSWFIGPASADNTASYLGIVANGFSIRNPKLEIGNKATRYVP